MSVLTPDAKQLLSTTIRGLRERLLRDIHDQAERSYHLSVPLSQAGLDEAHRRRRKTLDGWLEERVRAAKPRNDKERKAARERLLGQAVKEAGATLVNRLVLIRHLEAMGLSKPEVVTGGWASKGYQELRDFAPGLLEDETEGYGTLLQMVFDELAVDLPGLFGEVGLTRLFPVPPATLREVVTQLDSKELESAWTDDTTLGWVYQYWNDPEREALDAELDAQNKLAARDVGTKTQLFTERYMVEWLLQNSLVPLWFSICRKNGWVPAAEGLVAALPWKYCILGSAPTEAVASAPESIRNVKLLDPACGSGHFLVMAFDLLVPIYRDEARHRGETWTDEDIVESILTNNLHGLDIDARAVQIAAAALYLKAKSVSPKARPTQLNLVAPRLRLGDLPEDDPSVAELERELTREVGIPEKLTKRLLRSLARVDYLGSLLKVDAAIEEAVRATELSIGQAKLTTVAKLEAFLARHSGSGDLGLRLDGEELASGVRFVRMAREGCYDVVFGNPPYFGTQALADTDYIDERYPESKENLCTALLDRAMQMVRPGGRVAFVTVRNWLYVSQLGAFRSRVFRTFPPVRVADLGLGGFESLPGVEVTLVVAQEGAPGDCIVTHAPEIGTAAKSAAMMSLARTYRTDPALLGRLPGSPFVYRWSRAFVEDYLARPLLGQVAPVRVGMKTSDNLRFLRCPWEVRAADARASEKRRGAKWVPYVKGAAGKAWIEPLSDLVNWRDEGLEIRLALDAAYGQGPQGEKHFFKQGVAFTTIGRSFRARAHRFPSIFDVAGSSVLPSDVAATVCLLNSRFAREVVEDLNPTINFQVGDVARIPFRPDPLAASIYATLETTYSEHETTVETLTRFKEPGPSAWRYAQDWAQRAVDRPEGAPLPPYDPEYDPPSLESFVSFALGVALGRFGANGEGIVDEAPESALPGGILFVSSGSRDSVDHPACALLLDAWNEHGAQVGDGDELQTYLRASFFAYHKKLYENRPIYFPLSSAKKSFVAFVSIHRWQDDTLNVLLADHLVPEKRRLEGELEDIRKARAQASGKDQSEKRFAEVQKLLEELGDFIDSVTEIAECGPPPPDDRTPKREVDARFVMELDDGVMVNSSALWPLLEPQWKDPKKWWAQVAAQRGPKGTHFDWSTVARRYFPNRVTDECRRNPVLASAHGLLWKHHPETAYSWELRLRDGVRPDFFITEKDADSLRSSFLKEHADAAGRAGEVALKRRTRRSKGHREEGGEAREQPPGLRGADAESGSNTMTERLFDCDLCGGRVELVAMPGRTRELRTGVVLDVPESFPIPTCRDCGETYLTTEETERLETTLTKQLAAECRG